MRLVFVLSILCACFGARAVYAAPCDVGHWDAGGRQQQVAALMSSVYGEPGVSDADASAPPLLPQLLRQFSPEFRDGVVALIEQSGDQALWGRGVKQAALDRVFDANAMRDVYCVFSSHELSTSWVSLFERELFVPFATKRTVETTDFSKYAVHERLAALEKIAVAIEFADRLGDLEEVWAKVLLRLDNDLKPRGRRMSTGRLDVDIASYLGTYRSAARRAAPLVLLHRYRDLDDVSLEAFAELAEKPAIGWMLEFERGLALAKLQAWLTDNEAALAKLLEVEKRQALGLGGAREDIATQGGPGVEQVIDMYGKDAVIDFILHKRNARISVLVGEMKTYFGRPKPKLVTTNTILNDLRKLRMSVPQFSRALARFELYASAADAGHEFWASPAEGASRDLFPKRPVVEDDAAWSLAKVTSRQRKRASELEKKEHAAKIKETEREAKSAPGQLKKDLEERATEHVTKWLKLPTRKTDE
ncbi:MAG: hypothetical protein K0U93_10990 [Gammaproteobacteria bacterium]|nr:hypothetical protein [Gammaproteobacteria bacterium]